MKKSVFIILLLSCVVALAFAQEEPIPPRRAKAMKVGLFGGYTPGWLSVDVQPINDFLAAGKGAFLKDNGVFLHGGGGAAYIMVIPSLRVGGLGMSGGIKSTSLDGAGLRRDAELKVGFGGVTIEYVYTFFERFDVAAGIMLGAGGIDLTLRADNGGNNSWLGEQNLLASWPNGSANNSTRILSGSFYVWIPSVNLEYAILGWLAVRLGVSYVGMSAPSWQVDGKYDLIGVPSKVSGRGFMAQGGILLGTF